MLPDDIKPAMEGFVPSAVITCSLDGTPNASEVTQVYYVDQDHVALSFQFFNKTINNIRENPFACVLLRHPYTFERYALELEYDRSEQEGPVFNRMDMQIEAIASITGMSDVFKLKAADIYRVRSVTKWDTEIASPIHIRLPLPMLAGYIFLKLYIFIKKKIFKR